MVHTTMTKSIKETVNRSRLLAAFVFATGIAGSAAAQAAPEASASTQTAARTITLEEAINIALRQNSTLVQAENAAATADIAEKQAQMRFLPTFSASTSTSNAVGRNFSQDEGRIITSATQSVNAGISSSVTVFDGFANVANLRGARLSSVASDFDLVRARETVVFDVLTKYLALTQGQEQLGVQRQNLAAQEALLTQINAFVQANKRPIADQYTQQASVAATRVQELQSRRAVEIAKLNIVGSLRLDPLGEYNFVAPAAGDTIAQLSGTMEQMMQQALSKRVDLSAQQKRLQSNRRQCGFRDLWCRVCRERRRPDPAESACVAPARCASAEPDGTNAHAVRDRRLGHSLRCGNPFGAGRRAVPGDARCARHDVHAAAYPDADLWNPHEEAARENGGGRETCGSRDPVA